MISYTFQQATHVMRQKTGVVVPVYLPVGVDSSMGEALLRDNITTLCQQVDDPAHICLCVDGTDCGAEVTEQIAESLGVSTTKTPENRGKLFATTHGMQILTKIPDLEYFVCIDQDGDHFGNELLNLVRTALHITDQINASQVMVLGQRRSRHRPMGFLRGELEEFADRVLLDVLFYRSVITGRPLRLEYALTMDEFPDFHSGYKLFDRATAETIFLRDPELAGVSDTCYYRHSVEAVLSVEALEAGAYLGTVTRSTANEQPISTFGLYNRIQLVADKIIWPCRRLEIPLHFVKQWMANHIPRLLLTTMAPEGKEEIEQIRQTVLKGIGGEDAADADGVLQPLFV